MSRRNGDPGTVDLLLRLPQQIVSLAKVEFDNAKSEVVDKAKGAGIGVAAVVVALFFLFFMLQALLIAAVAALTLVWPWWLAALVVAAGLLVLAVLAILAGVMLIKRRGNLMSNEALERVGGDVQALNDLSINGGGPSKPGVNTVGGSQQ